MTDYEQNLQNFKQTKHSGFKPTPETIFNSFTSSNLMSNSKPYEQPELAQLYLTAMAENREKILQTQKSMPHGDQKPTDSSTLNSPNGQTMVRL